MAFFRVVMSSRKMYSLVVLAALIFPLNALAQDMWGSYCMNDVNRNRICDSTVEGVLATYDAPFPNHVIYEPSGKEYASSDPGTIVVAYRQIYLPPQSVKPAVYDYNTTFNPSQGVFPQIPGCSYYGCDSEQATISFLEQGELSHDPSATFNISGNYDTDFFQADGSVLGFGGDRKLNVTHQNSPPYSYQLGKFQEYTCTPGYLRRAGTNVSKAASGLSYAQLCGGSGPFWVSSSPQQRRSCPVNANPCYPTTGDKARFETDFIFGGRPFIRSYHSVQQVVMPGMPSGWWMSYGAHATFSDIVDDLGYVDLTQYGSDHNYHSKLDLNRYVVVTAPGYTSHAADGTSRDYDTSGLLVRVYDPQHPENDVLVSHDVWARVTQLTDSTGRVATFLYTDASSQGLLSTIQLPDGTTVHYDYDSARNLVTAHLPDGKVRQYLYDEPSLASGVKKHLLTGILDETGQRYASFGYDARGRVLSSKLHGGAGYVASTAITYGTDSAEVTTDGSGARSFKFATNEVANPISIATSGAGTTKRTYSYGRLASLTDPLSGEATYTYSDSFLSEQHAAVGTPVEKWTSFTRDTQGNLTQTKVHSLVNGAFVDLLADDKTYNGRAQVLTDTRKDLATGTSRVSSTTYCEATDVTAGTCPLVGLVTQVDGPRTDVADITAYSYYASDDVTCATSPTTCSHRKGDLWKVTNALGQVAETLAYDGAGRPLSLKDSNGVITDLVYSPRGWLTARKVRGPNNAVETDDVITAIDYWPTGLVKNVTEPDGAFTAYTYDTAQRLTDVADNAGNTMHYNLDNAGNRTGETTKDPLGTLARTLSRIYNQLGQLQTQTDAYQHATGFTYDANGNSDLTTDALSRVTNNDYDPLNRLSRTLQDTAGINALTAFQYDALDNLTKVTDPKGLATNYAYNALGDLLQLSSPDTGTTGYTYDSAGNRKTQTDARSKLATYSYDALNRLIGITYPTLSLNVTYAYDASQAACIAGETFGNGRLTKLTDASGATVYCYDRFGNLVRKAQTTNGKIFTVRYSYTLGGRLASITYPDNLLVDYVRDGLGRITQVGVKASGGTRQVLLTAATYAPFGPVTGWTFGNGRTMKRTLNQNYQPNTIQDSAVGGLSMGYEFDPVGNLSKLRTALQADPPLATYGYDALNRLSDVRDGPTGTVLEHYGYDATGNRLSVTVAGTLTSYTYPTTNHRVSQVGTVTRTYDADGNTTQIGGTARQFVYNDANRMSQIKAGTTLKMTYLYNGKGEQVRKYVGTTNTYTMYDEAGHWIGDYGTTGAPTQQVIWMDDLPVGLVATNGVNYVEPDALGSPRTVIDPLRSVAIWKWDLTGEAFGSTPPNQNPDADAIQFSFNMRYPGQRYDAASGLNYNYLRDYDAATGRYTESDPLGLVASPSSYSYVDGAPLGWADKFGLLKWGFNPVQWRVFGTTTMTYPGTIPNDVAPNSLARTTIDWNINSTCVCNGGGFGLGEFTVDITPVVFLRQSYRSLDERSSTRRAEMDHVGDWQRWSSSTRTRAQALEDSSKGAAFPTQDACKQASNAAMFRLLQSTAGPANDASALYWDASGRHDYVPGGN